MAKKLKIDNIDENFIINSFSPTSTQYVCKFAVL